MSSRVRFRSTNRTISGLSLGEALLTGQAPDKGLFMPEPMPRLEQAELEGLVGKSYPEIAYAVLSKYVDREVSLEVLRELCDDAYDFEVPLEHVTNRRYLLRLDRGPTASFKDFAARMMGRLIGHLVRQRGQRLVILTATSGDTGSAVAHAFYGVEGIQCGVLFPIAEVSNRQRKQMTTIGGNVTTWGVEGKFDDCQAMVKRAFADPDLASIPMSSANSINIGRLLPQSVYYLYSYLRLADVQGREPIIFSVPCGNFGDLCGGLLAHQSGLPVRRFVVATNANDEVPIFFDRGVYQKIEPSRVCLSNAMNVGHPSNLARLVDLYGGHMDETGKLIEAPDMERIRRDMWGTAVDDEETRSAIARAWEGHGVQLEPHGAVGWEGLERFFAAGEADEDALAVSLETAHPAKFPDEIIALTGVEPEPPPSLEGIDSRPEHYDTIGVDYPAFRDLLQKQFG